MKDSGSVETYISNFPTPVQQKLREIRSIVTKLTPQASEVVSYGIPTYQLNGKNVVHFGGYKTHIGFYPGSEAIEVFKKDLADYKTSKGTVQFDLEKTLPVGLIEKIVKFRLKKLNV